MRTGVILGFKTAGGKATMVCGPEVPLGEQRQRWRELRAEETGDFALLEKWESGSGRTKRFKAAKVQAKAKAKRKSAAGSGAGAGVKAKAAE